MGIADGIGVGGGEIKADSLSGSARQFRGSGVLVVGWDPVRSRVRAFWLRVGLISPSGSA
jgi:hypothetical protein